MDVEVLGIVLGVLVATVAIVGLITGLIGLWIVNRTMREAMKVTPEVLPLLATRMHQRRPWNLETWGLVGLATGVALAVAAAIGEPETRTAMLQASLLPGCIGAALFGQRWLPRRPKVQAIETVVEDSSS